MAPVRLQISIRLAKAAACLAAGAVMGWGAGALASPDAQVRPVAQQAAALFHDPRSPVLGDPKGDVTIVEFFDYACPTCRAAEPRIEALLRSDPHVRIVAKEYPVLSPESRIAARAALAAARQGRYAAYHQALMSFHGPLSEAAIFGVAQDVHLDVARLKRDMNAPEIAAEIDANLRLGHAIQAPGTPTLVADGRILTQSPLAIDFRALTSSLRQRRRA